MRSPYPGLRPFSPDEDALFFGRESNIDDVLGRLRRRRFVAIVGTSGSGKSSLVRAGLLPALYGGGMAGGGGRWRVAMFRPGGDPIANLTTALDDAGLLDAVAPGGALRKGLARAMLQRGERGLIEVIGQYAPAGENVLVLVDQFEELFRYAEAAGPDAPDRSRAFVKLLLAAAREPDLPVSIVITMRSDFLGACARYRDLPESVNDGLYLIPRMTREQMRSAIVGPALVAGVPIAPRLVTRLLNDLSAASDDGDDGETADELPILQHALMRTWERWTDRGASGELDTTFYEEIGSLGEALSLHAEDVFLALSELDRIRTARLFKALTTRDGENRGVRRPQRFADLCSIVAVKADDLAPIIERFRAPSCSFLMPPPDVPLEDGTVIDIVHESLMRRWKRLSRWVDDEAASAAQFERLAASADLHADGKAALLRDPDLAIARSWYDDARPNVAWAEQYGEPERFDRAIHFLMRSRDAARAARRARATRQWLAIGSVSIVAIVLAVLLGLSFTALRASQAAQVATEAAALGPEQIADASILAVEALKHDGEPQTRGALFTVLDRVPRLRRIFHGLGVSAWSPDGRYLAMSAIPAGDDPSQNEEIVWDVDTNTVAERWTFPIAHDTARHAEGAGIGQCFSGSRLLRLSRNGYLHIFDWRTGHTTALLAPQADSREAFGVACFVRSQRAAIVAAAQTTLIDVPSGRIVKSIPFPATSSTNVPSADGTLIAIGGDRGSVEVISTRDGTLRARCETGAAAEFSVVAFLADGTIVAATLGGNTLVHFTANCRNLPPIPIGARVFDLADTGGGTLLTLFADGSIHIVNPANPEDAETFSEGLDYAVHGIHLDSRGRWVAADGGRGVELFAAGPYVRPLRMIARRPTGDWYAADAFPADADTLLAIGGSGTIDRWSILNTAQSPHSFATAVDRADGPIAIGPAATVIFRAFPGIGIRSFPVPATSGIARTFAGSGIDSARQLAVSRDGSHLIALLADARLAAIDLATGSVRVAAGSGSASDAATLSPHGEFVVREIEPPHAGTVFSSAETAAITLGRTYDVSSTGGDRLFQHHDDGPASLAGFSDDDRLLFLRAGDHIDLWRIADGVKERGRLDLDGGETEPDVVAAGSPGNRWIAVSTALADGRAGVQLYDFPTRMKIGSAMPGARDAIVDLHFSPDARWLAARTASGAVFVWEIGIDAWRERACDVANEQLDADVWTSYGVPFAFSDTCAAYGIPVAVPQPTR